MRMIKISSLIISKSVFNSKPVGLSLILGIGFMFITSCSKDDAVEPKHPCDTVEVTYAGVIQPLLQSKCYSCHANGSANGGVELGSYEGVKVVADNGRLSGALNHEPGFTAMPGLSPKLDSCTLYQVDKWIEEGALNN